VKREDQLVSLVYLSVLFVWLYETNQRDQSDQMDQIDTDRACLTLPVSKTSP
jgi:hypothetical protein